MTLHSWVATVVLLQECINRKLKPIVEILLSNPDRLVLQDRRQEESWGLIYPQEIGISKYKEMLMASVENSLEILGYGSTKRME
ncbi:MAG: hypothetical protein M3275_15585 [Thermoproteota archaeon]|nr:hypothetical protein [Thermoproteota archaeon]